MTSTNVSSAFSEVMIFQSFNYSLLGVGTNSSFDEIVTNGSNDLIRNGTITKSTGMRPASRVPMVMTLCYYTCPVLFVLGLLSNILAYLVFTRTHLRKVPSVPYLAAMAVVDSGALVTDFIQTGLPQHNIYLIVYNGVCQYVTYFNFVFIFLCMWYPVALCVEKFIAVYCPLRAATLCTPFRAKVVVIGMAIMAGTCYYYVIYMTGPYYITSFMFVCREWKEIRHDFSILMRMDIIFVGVLPTLILILLLSLICFRGYEYYRISSAVELSSSCRATGSQTRGAGGGGGGGGGSGTSSRASVRVTNVIFPVVLVMLLLKVPLNFLRFMGIVSHSAMLYTSELQPVFLYIARFEWAVKFHLYLIFSPSFRRKTLSYLSSFAFVRSKLTRRYSRSLSDEPAGRPPRIHLADRNEPCVSPRSRRLSSDV